LGYKKVIYVLFFVLLVGVLYNYQKIYAYQIQRKYSRWVQLIPDELQQTPYVSVIELSKNRNDIFYNGHYLFSVPVSTGSRRRYRSDRTMREAVWRLGRRVSSNLQSIYGPRLIYLDQYNPIKHKFIHTAKAFHGTNEPNNLGKATSMGCVYHHNDVIIPLYDMLPDKTLVITVKK